MGRHSCCYKQKLRKGLWSPEEDEKLLNYITKHGHGCWSSVPKLAVENCTEKQRPTADTSNEKVSIVSNELNLIEAAATLKPPAIPSSSKINTSINSSKDRNSSGSNMTNTPPTQEFFLDRFGTSHESSPASCRPSDLMGFFPFQKLDYKRAIGLSMNPNTTLCFNPNSSSSEMISHEFNSSMTPPSIHPSVSTPMFQTPIRVKPSVSLPSDHNPSVASCDVNGVQNWEASSFSNGSSSSIELQSNTNFYESSAFSWGSSRLWEIRRGSSPSVTRKRHS
ncbi:HOMEODOMAIN-RELATED [Salix viminalis]|uniref:HOMEODOMAIN-RELATED n=1 Tax=Salix viminalis TaxID=40686 RepID=A0A9Q0ZKE8_SALVM|nr:HOMEODOMAIN-RELATED [Salix viminalis]